MFLKQEITVPHEKAIAFSLFFFGDQLRFTHLSQVY